LKISISQAASATENEAFVIAKSSLIHVGVMFHVVFGQFGGTEGYGVFEASVHIHSGDADVDDAVAPDVGQDLSAMISSSVECGRECRRG
jgi:hypothetical protein